jgi:beta-glucanase (GH16 family)
MAKNPKVLSIIFWGVILALLLASQAGRAALVATRDRSGASNQPASSSLLKENIPTRRHPRYPETAKLSLNTSKPSLRISSVATLPVGAKALTGPPGDAADWILTFSDEFDGESLNPDKWATEYGLDTYCIVDDPPPPGTPTYCNRSNNDEKEWYIDESPFVEAGVLKLVANINDCSGDGSPDRSYAPYTCLNFPYLSGMVSTHDRFSQLYGYFEARIKLVNGQGFWPAFWLIPQLPSISNPAVEYFWPPEIDIMENKGQEPDVILMTHHYSGVFPEPGSKLNNWSYGGSEGSIYRGPDYSADFHTYAVEWQPGLIIWYIDGIEQFRSTNNTPPGTINPPDYSGEMHIILNLAIGGGGVGYLLPPDELLPATMEVDYVRVYQNDSFPLAGFTSNSPVALGETAIFTNTSTGTEPLSFVWDFGDTFTSTLRHPTHSYTAVGSYTVTLTTTNNNGRDTLSHDFVVLPAITSIYLPWLTKE